MNFGMIGAIGGAGQGFVNEGAFLAKQDDANAGIGRKKDYQGWLLQQQEQYQIRSEQRQDARGEAQKDRDFARTQNEAPVRRDIAVEDDKAKVRGKSAVAAETVDSDAAVKQKLTVAGKTPEDREKDSAQADQARAAAEYYRGAKTDAALGKVDALTTERVKALDTQIGKIEEEWNKGVMGGSIVQTRGPDGKPMTDAGGRPVLGTPEQREVLRRVAVLRQQRDDLVAGARRPRDGGGGGSSADPLGLAQEAAQPKPQPGMVGAFTGSADDATMAVASIKDPQERANAQAALQAQLRAGGGKLPPAGQAPRVAAPAPAPARAPAAAPAPLTDQQQLDALDQGQVAQVDDEVARAGRERRAPHFEGQLAKTAEVVRNLRAKITAAQQAQAGRGQVAERARQQAANDQVRQEMAGFSRRN